VAGFSASPLASTVDKIRSSNTSSDEANDEAIDLQWQISDQFFCQMIAVRSD
jgi:hypothetical protein